MVYFGELFGLIGYNGVGKSMLFKMFFGLEVFIVGEVCIGGQFMSSGVFCLVWCNFGYLLENVVFYDNLIGQEMLEFFVVFKCVL